MNAARTGGFRAPDRLLRSRDFLRLRREGKAHRSRNFLVSVTVADSRHLRRTSVPGNRRLGVTVSRAVGNAAVRSRVKRCIREWFRGSRHLLAEDIDLVVIARRGAAAKSGREIAAELCSALRIPHHGDDGR